MRLSLVTLIFATTATPLFAETASPLPLTYETFEVSIPHVDLENCPDNLAAAEVFCRATLANDQMHVFAFSEKGDSPLVGFASFDVDNLTNLLN